MLSSIMGNSSAKMKKSKGEADKGTAHHILSLSRDWRILRRMNFSKKKLRSLAGFFTLTLLNLWILKSGQWSIKR